MRKLCILLFVLITATCTAAAEIACRCNESSCTCFIQFGDEGPAVEYIQNSLVIQGYLDANSDGSTFDQRTLQAVIRFQEAHDLPATGMLDDKTLTLLLWGMLPEELDQRDPFSNGNAIWIPTDGGIRRHWKKSCSKMYDPRLVSVRNAEKMDMQPCGICNRKGRHEQEGDAP